MIRSQVSGLLAASRPRILGKIRKQSFQLRFRRHMSLLDSHPQPDDAETSGPTSESTAKTSAQAEHETTEAEWWAEVQHGPWGLLCQLRGLTQGRPGECRTRRTARTVQVVMGPQGGVSLRGVSTCSSVWACPVCSAAICAERAHDVKALVESWGPARTVLLTCTIAHEYGDLLARHTRGVARAWQALWAGRGAEKAKKTWGIGPWVRALEVTRGRNGWHAHIHAILCLDRELPNGQYLAEDWGTRWASAVASHIGLAAVPSAEHGVDCSPVRRADYLTKLGLEVSGARKVARRRGHEHPWDIAERAAKGDPEGIMRWREYVAATKGHRQLTWSRDAQRRIRTDAEVVSGGANGEMLLEFGAPEWRRVVERPYGVAEVMRLARDSVQSG